MTAPRIALLDNDPAVLSLMHTLLTEEGYRTLRCRPDDVLSAHALVKRARPALVILDLWLAQRDSGWAFLKHLWDDTETAQIPTLIVTEGPFLLPTHAAALHARRCPVVRKPFDLRDLLDAIGSVLGPSPARVAIPQRREALPFAVPSTPDEDDSPRAAANGEGI